MTFGHSESRKALTQQHSVKEIRGSSKLSKATHCLRHPDKKVKYFCESDTAFLCSRCVLSHTGSGHLIQECRLDLARIKSDFADVKSKHFSLL